MSRSWVRWGLAAAVTLQLGVLAAEYLNAARPLWTGREIRLRTVPVDPRSIFRGNYARLSYDISRVPAQDLVHDGPLRPGEVVYVRLRPSEGGLFEYAGASATRPAEGMFIRGRLEQVRRGRSTESLAVRYGIEAWFSPPDKARALEKDLRDGGVAVVMIAGDGKAALKAVLGEGI